MITIKVSKVRKLDFGTSNNKCLKFGTLETSPFQHVAIAQQKANINNFHIQLKPLKLIIQK
jgi:hypothetical protein